jgi:nucleoside-triphosphatase THEP1
LKDVVSTLMSDRLESGMRPPKVVLLTAPSGLGKTTACRRTVELAQARGLRAAGLLSLPVYQDGVKTAIMLHDISTGQAHVLARANQAGDGPRVGIWTFDPLVVAWGQRVLASLASCDLLVIDEIGPLELETGQGLTNALDALRHGAYRLALVTIRPTLAECVAAQLGWLEVSITRLDEQTRDEQPQTVVAQLCPGRTLTRFSTSHENREER